MNIKKNTARTNIAATALALLLPLALRPTTQAQSALPRAKTIRPYSVVGPGGGGAMFNPTISPHDPAEVLVSCDMTGAYISHNGGHSWRMFNLRGAVQLFAFDPIRPHVIYAANHALWRSEDDGDSWRLLWPNAASVRGVRMNSDHADETILANTEPVGEIVALAIDSKNSHHLYAGATRQGKAALFSSVNDGRIWKKEVDLPETPRHIWIDPYSQTASRTLYVAGKQGVTVRQQGHWQQHSSPAGTSFVDMSTGFAALDESTFYATSGMQIFVSHDGAKTWNPSPFPGNGAEIRAIATSLHHPDIAYASYSHLQLEGKQWLGVARTRDAGNTWQFVWKEDKTEDPSVHDAWITPQLGPDWGENPLALVVADQNPNLAYGTDLGRTMVTTDGGANWQASYSAKTNRDAWTSTGLDVTNSYGYLVDPFDANRRFIPTTDVGLFRSEDKGLSWTRSLLGVPEPWINTTYWLVFDPAVRNKIWAVMSGTHDLPRPKMWRKTSTDTYQGGVCVSIDGGRTWKPSSEGMPETAPTHILIDPSSPANHRTLWVAAMGRGVYKSNDDGKTWALKDTGITQKNPLAWRLSRTGDGTLYLVVARRNEDGSIGTPGDGALYRSVDGAESWTPISLPQDVNGPNGIAIDPNDPQRLYLATWGRATPDKSTGGGIYLSTDAGATWHPSLTRDQHIYDVTIEPRNSNILYAAGFESSAWRSSDRGNHWTRIPGFNFKWAQRVTPDLDDPTMIYITTFGGGVWHGPSQGGNDYQDISTVGMQPTH